MPIITSAPILSINRLRLNSDGAGIRTLVAFYGCPLKCEYCLNPECHEDASNYMTPCELYDKVRIDDLYFRSSRGGITFGGGEPLLYPTFINVFKELCHSDWNITLETSLNIPLTNLMQCYKSIDNFIVDIKCLSDSKYKSYTGRSNNDVWSNLRVLIGLIGEKRICVRIPYIPKITEPRDIDNAYSFVSTFGVTNINQFDYILPESKEWKASRTLNHGKQICNSLKKLRNKIANSNGLIIHAEECNYQGLCLGTCPQCDEELKILNQYLSVLERYNVRLNF